MAATTSGVPFRSGSTPPGRPRSAAHPAVGYRRPVLLRAPGEPARPGHDILIVGGKELYDPARKPLHGLFDFASEQARTVVRDGLRNRGLPRRPGRPACGVGQVHASRLRGALEFGRAFLGLPFHASRFDIEGDVLHGPAPEALEKVELQGNDAPPPRTPRAGVRGRNAR